MFYFSITAIVTAPKKSVLKVIFLNPASSINCLYSLFLGKWRTDSGRYLYAFLDDWQYIHEIKLIKKACEQVF